MANETKIEAQAAAEAPAKVATVVADTAEKVVEASVKTAKRERASATRRAKRQAAATKPTARRAKTSARKVRTAARRTTRTAARQTAAAAQQGINTMTNTNFFKGFDAIPAFAPFQSIIADANGRGQEFAKRGQKAAEEFANVARANVEALVEAGRVAAEGARTIGQDFIATGRDNVEQAADAVRSLAEAKSPTEYMQLQGDFARASFDRLVAESSRLTETMVKLAGEAFQPLSNRATANAERLNAFVA